MAAIRRTTSRPEFLRRFTPLGPTIRGLLIATLLLNTPPVSGASQPDGSAAPPVQPDPAATQVERALAAFRAEEPNADAEIIRLLRSPEFAGAVLAGLGEAERLPASIWRAVSTCTTDEFTLPTRTAATRLLPRFASREAAIRLIVMLDDPDATVAQTARQSLRDLTGLGEHWGSEEWKAWGVSSAEWSDRVWTSAIVSRQAARARALTERQRVLGDEVVTLYRRLHVELDAPGRTVLLAELIRDERAPLRDLGFELAGRDLSARTQLGPEVATAAAERLSHPDATTRARAATLISRLVPPDAMVTLTRALKSESSPIAAEPLLLSIARWPNEEAVQPTVRWLERADAPFGAVATALWALAHAELLSDPVLSDRVVGTLRQRDPARGGEPALKLLVRLGNADDLARVAALLTVPEDPQRNAAAAALAESPAGAALLIEAATTDPRLFGPASRAIITHVGGPQALGRLAGLPAIDAAIRDAAIVELGSKLRPEELAAAVGAAGLSASVREAVLTRLADADHERTPGVIDGLMLLAEARIELRRAVEALAVLRIVDPALLGESQTRRHARLRLIATVLSGDLGEARGMEPPTLNDWLTAWRLLPDASDLRHPVAAAIMERFSDQITEQVRVELGQTIPQPDPPETPQATEDHTETGNPPSGDAG
jgi:hypothetical protein